ncbi:MAG: SAM-dependent methyltransferase [Phascolarctobacterium sp.]|nr:SAM-dependent methyltransferase [Phascolarctobacterium sp.]
MAEYVLTAADKGDVIYTVPGSPFVAEHTVIFLLENALKRKIKIDIWPAMSFLDLAYGKLGIDPVSGLRIVDTADFEAISAAGSYLIIVTQVYSRLVASDLKIALMDVLNDVYPVYFFRNLGLPDEECRKIKLYELDRQTSIDHLTSIFVPAQAEEVSGGATSFAGGIFNIQPLAEVIGRLRSPGGCPWDIEQTHDSIRSNIIEEVYEYLEAVDDHDFHGMRKELRDILMQVVFHTRMAEEAGNFNLQDVIDEVTEKLIRRHPHVFGNLSVAGSDDVLHNLEAIKKLEKN